MEYWDLYDKDRKPLNKKHLRGEQFEEGEYYFCCEVWIVNSKGEYFTTKRHPSKKSGNLWEFTGGGTLAGETTLQSAVRETFEETGIKLQENEITLMTTYQHKNYFQDIYLVKKDFDLKDVVLQQEETIDAKWADSNEIQNMIANGEFVYSVGLRYGMFKDLVK